MQVYHDTGPMQVPNYLHHSKKAQKPTKKPQALRAAKKAGRVVGISADENKLLQNLLQTVQEDANYSIISKTAPFTKLAARYNTK